MLINSQIDIAKMVQVLVQYNMNFANLSPNVKQYFVHALKGIGVGFVQDNKIVEMSESQIATFLNKPETTITHIYNSIKYAVLYQFSNDASRDNSVQKMTSFNRVTAQSIFANEDANPKIKLGQAVAQNYLNDLCGVNDCSLDNNIRTVIETLKTGLVEQKSLTKEQKDEAGQFWDRIRDNEYHNWIGQEANAQQNPQLTAGEYYGERQKVFLVERTMTNLNCDQQTALNFLNTRLDEKSRMFLASSGELLTKTEKYCQSQKRDPKQETTVADVLFALSHDCDTKKVITYFQSRSQEQRVIEKQPDQKEVTKENKVGNLMGKQIREAFKKENGGFAVYYDKDKLKSGKTGWRGYKQLYDRISNFLNQVVYRPVQSIGFTERIMIRKGFLTPIKRGSKNVENANNEKDNVVELWSSGVETEMPADFLHDPKSENKFNILGEFYHETKARLVADKMRFYQISADLADTLDNDTQELKKAQSFYQGRIKRAEEGLAKLDAMKANGVLDSEEAQQKFVETTEKFILETDLEKIYEAGKEPDFVYTASVESANDSMVNALQTLQTVAQGTTHNQIQAKANMAVELFGLHQQCNNGVFKIDDLSGMVDRFVANNQCQDLINKLSEHSTEGRTKIETLGTFSNNGITYCNERLKSNDYNFRAVDANAEIKKFAVKDLQQNAVKNQYAQYITDQNRSKVLQAVSNELNREM